MTRTVLSVIAGFVGWTVAWLAGNAALRALAPDAYAEDGSSTSAALLAALLVLSVAASLGAGALTGALARDRRGAAGWALGAALLLVGVGVQASLWDAMPLWYHAAFLALLVPAARAGAQLSGRSRST